MFTTTLFKKLSITAAGAAFIALGGGGGAQAATFHEIGDAGVFPFSWNAQVAAVGLGETLDSIAGTFTDWSDIDMFQVDLTAGFFSASTSDGTVSGSRSLFLFDANGLGLAANLGNGILAELEGILVNSGTYFLGIGSGQNYDWGNSAGSIFSASDFATPQFGATGPGAGSIPGYVSRSGPVPFGSYLIAITNGNTQSVPEPSSVLGVLVVGALGAGAARKRKQQA